MWLLRDNHRSGWFHWRVSCVLLALAAVIIVAVTPVEEQVEAILAAHTYTKLPLHFVENRGQLDDRIAYYVQGRDKTIYFTPDGLTYSLQSPKARQRWILKLDFVGANPHVRLHGEKQTQASISHFSGPRENWQTGIRTYNSVVYTDLWPGIDLIYEGTPSRMKYRFVLKPDADPNQIRLAYRGADRVAINSKGELEVVTPEVTFHDEAPVSFQGSKSGSENEREVEVATAYRIEGPEVDSGTVVYGFQIGEYDRSRELVIDPAVLVYAGFIGGSGRDYGIGIAADGAGNAYVTGLVDSPAETFPVTAGADVTYGGNNDAFVAKIKADGTGLIYCGYIGGAGRDEGYGVSVDSQGYAYVAGLTTSDQTTFPVLGGPGLTHSGFGDAFVARIQADGTGLVYCGYIGGNEGDGASSIALDTEGNAYITGFTGSFQGFPALVGPDLSYNLNVDAFVAKVKADGTGLVYCGFIGGSSFDRGNGIKVDAAGNAYIVGDTSSNQNTFPVVVGPDLSLNVTQDVFVARVKADGTGLTYCGYIGGRESEFGNGIAIDSAGNAYIGGWTTSSESSFPVRAGPDLTFNGYPASPDAFVAKVRFDGLGLDYCGYIGGSDLDQGFALAIDNRRNVYITGSTRSNESSFPVRSGPDLTFNGGSDDAFVAMVSESGAKLVYCGYIGGDRQDAGFGIATDILGNVYVTGTTSSDHMASGFPAKAGPDLTYNGGGDSLIAKIGAHNLTVTSVSAASFLGGTIAVESITAAFGAGLATGIHAAATIPLPTSIAGHEVRVKDSAGMERPAPLFYISPDQINYQVPFGTASGPALITVLSSDGSTATGTVQIAPTAPGLFAANANGQGVASALIFRVKADGSESYDSAAQFDETVGGFVYRPIDLGPDSDEVFLLLFASGIRFRSSLSSVSVTIGGYDLPVIFAGAHPDDVGLDQITVRLSRALMGRGEVAINLIVDATTANKLWVSFH